MYSFKPMLWTSKPFPESLNRQTAHTIPMAKVSDDWFICRQQGDTFHPCYTSLCKVSMPLWRDPLACLSITTWFNLSTQTLVNDPCLLANIYRTLQVRTSDHMRGTFLYFFIIKGELFTFLKVANYAIKVSFKWALVLYKRFTLAW